MVGKRFPLKNRLSILGRNPTLLQTLQSVTREVISLIDGLVRDFTDAGCVNLTADLGC